MMDKIDKTVIGGMASVIGMLLLAQAVRAAASQPAQPSTPSQPEQPSTPSLGSTLANILDVNGIPFSEVGAGYAVLSQPVVMSSPVPITLHWNDMFPEYFFVTGGPKQVFWIQVEYVKGSSTPGFQTIQTFMSAPSPDAVIASTPGSLWVSSDYIAGLYDGVFHIYQMSSDDFATWNFVRQVAFTIKNMVQMSGSGHFGE